MQATLLALRIFFLVCWCLTICTRSTGLGFCPLVHECLLEHANVLVQLVVELLSTPDLALLLRDFGLHLRAFDIPCVPGALVTVPFEL
jgi:hypothetical protein